MKVQVDKKIIALSLIAKLVLLVGAGAFLTGCNQANSTPQASVVKPVKLYEIPALGTAEADAFLAQVDAGERSQLSFQVPGVIEKLTVREGQEVNKDDVLVALDAVDYQLAVDASQAQYDLAAINYKRDRQLVTKKLISTDTFEQSETSYKAAEAKLEQAKTDLSYTTLKAPFAGVVSLRFVKKHQYVDKNKAVVNILSIDNLDVDFSLPVTYVENTGISKLRSRQFTVVMDGHSDIVIPAKFKEISTSPDADTNSYSATVSMLRPDSINILPGMTGQVHVLNEDTVNALFIPEKAFFVNETGEKAIWRFDPQTQTVKSVVIELNEFGAVVNGLATGDLVVIAGAKDLIEGQAVRAWEREGGI